MLPAPLHSIHSSSAPSPLTQHPFKQCSQPPYTASIQAVLPAPLHSIHPSSAPSPLTVQTPAEVEESMLRTDPGLQCARDLRSRFEEIASLVEGQLGFLEWQDNSNPSSKHVNRDRCIPPRVGCGDGRSVHEWPVVCRRESSPHQCTRAESRGLCSQDLCIIREGHACPATNGQQDCGILYQQDGRNQIFRSGSTSLPTVAMVSPEGDNNFSRVSPRSGQLCSRPRVTPPPVVSRVETKQASLSLCNQDDGQLQYRPICNTSKPPAQEVCQLETGPVCHSHRRNDTLLEGQRRICIPTFLPDREMPAEGGRGEGDTDTHSTHMEHSTLVPSSSGPADSTPSLAAAKARPPDRPIQSALSKERPAASRLEGIRRQHSGLGLSEGASDLIQAGWSKGTNTAYQSAWSRWVSWCDKREVDPLHCGIRSFLDFLADCFEEGLQHRTISLVRSAISMTHEPVEGVPLGQHPLVTRLMKGVSNSRPPCPRYASTWDVDLVLNYLLTLGENKDMSLKTLSKKLVLLLALTDASRCSELHALDLRY